MAGALQGAKVAFLVANEGVEELELTGPWEAAERWGCVPTLIAPKADLVQAYEHHDRAGVFKAEIPSGNADADKFDALVIPGGVINADALRLDAHSISFVRHFFDLGKPVAAICHGPWAVIEAGLANGRTMTSWPSLQTDIRNAGATWIDNSVVICNNGPAPLITSRKPDDIPAFNAAISDALQGRA